MTKESSAMYEQNKVPVLRRILWYALWLIVIVAVLWTAIWLIFFRTDTKKVATTKPSSQQTQQGQPTATPAPSPSSSTTPTTNTTPATTPTTSTDDSQLPNTGPGSVAIPVVAAAALGSTLYYIRTRKKLLV